MLLKLFIALVVGGLLFFLGAFTALAPQFIARLLILPLLILFVLFAFLGKSPKALSAKTEKAWLIVLIATMALWPSYMLVKFGGLPTLDARRIIAGSTILGALYFVIARQPLRSQFKALFSGHLAIVNGLLICYVLIRVSSCFVSIAPLYSLVQVFWEVLYYYSMFFIGALLFSKPQLQNVAMKTFMILSALIALFAMVEWVSQFNVLVQFAPSNDEFSNLQRALEVSRLRGGFFRAQSTFEHPLLLAEFSAMAVCFGLSALLWNTKISHRWLGLIILGLATIAAILTGSRSAFVSIPIAASFIFIVWLFASDSARKQANPSVRKGFVMLCFGLIFLLTIPLIVYLVEGSSRSEAASSAGRFYMLQLGWESIKAHPFLGTGPGTSGSVAGIMTGAGIGTLDNYFLAIAIESGLTGLVLLLLVLLYPVWVAFSALMSDSEMNRPFTSSVMGLLIVTVVVHTILWMPYNLFFAFIFIGMLLGSMRQASR